MIPTLHEQLQAGLVIAPGISDGLTAAIADTRLGRPDIGLVSRTAQAYYAALAQHGSNLPFADRMFDFTQRNELIGTPAMLALGRGHAA